MDTFRDRATTLLRAVADNDPSAHEQALALAEAVLDHEVVALAHEVLEGDERLAVRHAVELAAAIVATPAEPQEGAQSGEDDEPEEGSK